MRSRLPDRVTIVEVAPRDGLQAERTTIPTDAKLEFIDRLVAAGHTVVEVTSFVSPDAVPQLADAEELLRRLPRTPGVRYPVLVPNARGLERALEVGVREVAVFLSVSESYSRKNLRRSRADALEMVRPVVARAKDAGLRVRGYLSMVIADPWDGPTPLDVVVDTGRELLDQGCDELSLGDTIGIGTAADVQRLIIVQIIGTAGGQQGQSGQQQHADKGQMGGHGGLRWARGLGIAHNAPGNAAQQQQNCSCGSLPYM